MNQEEKIIQLEGRVTALEKAMNAMADFEDGDFEGQKTDDDVAGGIEIRMGWAAIVSLAVIAIVIVILRRGGI